MEFYRRPNRSDVHLSREEEAKIEEDTRDYFDGIAPRRHTKPSRSEYSNTYVDALATNGVKDFIPELAEFHRLETDTQKLMCGGCQVPEEFVETEYYRDLNCIDKQHHRTGTGFIKMENANKRHFSIEPDNTNDRHASCKGNPATNDWIPVAADVVTFASDKPSRSDN